MCDDKMNSCGANQGSCGGHGMCCHGWGHKYWLKALLAAVVLSFVFCAGVKFGEMKALYGGWDYERGYGYPAMMNGGVNYGYGMMRTWNEAVPPASQAVTTSKK